jgi:HAD superfamily hydrolase (TIGR01509 family)
MLKRFFPKREFKALLFDFDGTVADTMPAHLDAWNRALKIYDLSLSQEQHLEWAGRPTRQIVELLNIKHGAAIVPDDFLKAKERDYFASIKTVREIKSVVEIIKHYKGKIPMAIVSGSRRKPVETTLAHLKLGPYFDTLVCAEDYANGKPAPDCFLIAAKRLNVAPEECLVFEDGQLGIEAAHAAGMACMKVTDKFDLQVIEKNNT